MKIKLRRLLDSWLARSLITVAAFIALGWWIEVKFPAVMGLGDFFNLVGLLIGIYAAMEAARAESKAKESLNQLKETALIVSEAKNDFKTVFENFLVQPLKRAQNKPVKAYLLLSTPAYGFPVLGSSRFSELTNRFERCSQKLRNG